jgi:hypothetical protein
VSAVRDRDLGPLDPDLRTPFGVMAKAVDWTPLVARETPAHGPGLLPAGAAVIL